MNIFYLDLQVLLNLIMFKRDHTGYLTTMISLTSTSWGAYSSYISIYEEIRISLNIIFTPIMWEGISAFVNLSVLLQYMVPLQVMEAELTV